MVRLSRQIDRLTVSSTARFFERVAELRAAGKDIISLATGESTQLPPQTAMRAAHAALEKNLTKYTVNSSTLELRQAVSAVIHKDHRILYPPEQVLISNGAKQAAFNLIYATVGPGDEVILFAPYYVSYLEQIRMVGATEVIVESRAQNGYQINSALLRSAITDRTRLIILNTPNNPTGTVYSEDSLSIVLEIVRQSGCFLLSDEIYERIVFPPARHLSPLDLAPELKDYILLVNGVSKSYAMTGFRIGYAAGPEKVIAAAGIVQSHTTNCPSSISQQAALAALTSNKEFTMALLGDLSGNRQLASESLGSIEGVIYRPPDGAF